VDDGCHVLWTMVYGATYAGCMRCLSVSLNSVSVRGRRSPNGRIATLYAEVSIILSRWSNNKIKFIRGAQPPSTPPVSPAAAGKLAVWSVAASYHCPPPTAAVLHLCNVSTAPPHSAVSLLATNVRMYISHPLYTVEAKAKKIHTKHTLYFLLMGETVTSSCNSAVKLIVLMASCLICSAQRLNQVYS